MGYPLVRNGTKGPRTPRRKDNMMPAPRSGKRLKGVRRGFLGKAVSRLRS
jgi:hypothetical protein